MLATAQPIPHFFDLDGSPLSSGSLYFGVAGQNPETNQITVYWDAAGTQPAAQPIPTLNGYPVRSGSPALIYSSGNYSLTVRDRWGRLVFTAADSSTFNAAAAADTLRTDLATATAPKGAALAAYAGSQIYAASTVGSVLNDAGCSPRSLGAVGDGVTDDAAYIQQCLTYSRTLDLRNRSWKIGSTITLPAGCCVDMRGATVIAATGSNPLFQASGNIAGITILGGGGTVEGTAGAFLKCIGTTATPSDMSHYVRFVTLSHIMIRPSSIGLFLDLQNACRYVYVDSCYSFTSNGINASGKINEIFIAKSFIFSSSAAVGTYGVKLRSPGGSIYYNEGWIISDSTVDGFELAFDVEDVFDLQVANSYIGTAGSAGDRFCAVFGYPTTTACFDIKFDNVLFQGRVKFAPGSSGYDYSATFTGCTTFGTTTYGIEFANNASGVSVRAHKFKNGGGIAVRGASNNSRIVVHDIDVDATYATGGVFIQGANGTDCSVAGVSYAGAGEQIFIERPVRINGLMAATATGALIKRNINSGSISGSYTVGSTIVTLSGRFVKGETGLIIARFQACSGLDASTQRFDIGLPAGMVAPTGTGWDSKLIFPGVATGVVQFVVPYHCTADIPLASGNITITNAAGNTATIGGHSWAAIEHNF